MYSHYLYFGFTLYSIIFEITAVLIIQRKFHDKNFLQLNVWHFVELVFGQISRADTYLCVCFLYLVLQCQLWEWIIPSMLFICLHQIPGIFAIIKLGFQSKDHPLYHS